MPKRQRIHRNGVHFSSRYRTTHDEKDQLSRTTLMEMANRMIGAGADGTMEVFQGQNVKGHAQTLYAFLMVEPTDCDELIHAFCAAVAGLINRDILRPGNGIGEFLPDDFAPPSNTGLHEQRARPTAGDEGHSHTGPCFPWEHSDLN